jgi:peptidyl-prolyl cis-trans isomerase SurA
LPLDKKKENMNRKLVLILFLLINFQVFAQKESDILLTVDDEPVTVGEFKYIYEKNSREDDSLYLRKNLMEYLELFKNFKLKVHAAKEAGIDTSASFLKEYNTYRNQLAEPYLNARETTNELVKESYDRLSEERRASHILIRVSEDAKPSDTLDAYNKINALLRKIQILNRIKTSDNPENTSSLLEEYKKSSPELN